MKETKKRNIKKIEREKEKEITTDRYMDEWKQRERKDKRSKNVKLTGIQTPLTLLLAGRSVLQPGPCCQGIAGKLISEHQVREKQDEECHQTNIKQ